MDIKFTFGRFLPVLGMLAILQTNVFVIEQVSYAVLVLSEIFRF